MPKERKSWYKSKTKWAGILTGISFALPGIAAWLSTGEPSEGLQGLWKALIAILGVFGVRDALDK